jgi:hypothetical protein
MDKIFLLLIITLDIRLKIIKVFLDSFLQIKEKVSTAILEETFSKTERFHLITSKNKSKFY